MHKKLLTAILTTFTMSAYAQDKPAAQVPEPSTSPKENKAAETATEEKATQPKEADTNNSPQYLRDSIHLLNLYEKQLTEEMHEDIAKKATDDQIISVARNIIKIQDAITVLKALETIHIQAK